MENQNPQKLKEEYLNILKTALLQARTRDGIVSEELMEKIETLLKSLYNILDQNTYLEYALPFFTLDDYLRTSIAKSPASTVEEAIDAYNELIFHEYHDPNNKNRLSKEK